MKVYLTGRDTHQYHIFEGFSVNRRISQCQRYKKGSHLWRIVWLRNQGGLACGLGSLEDREKGTEMVKFFIATTS